MRAAVRLGAALLAGGLATSVAACTAAPPNRATDPASISSAPFSPAARMHDAGCGPARIATLPVQQVGAASSRSAWAIVGADIRHTADGGRHWRVQFHGGPDAGLVSVDVLDGSRVWAVTQHGLLRTTDAGARWQQLPAHCPVIHAVDFVDADHGYAIAGGWNGGLWRDGTLWHTADAGSHWQRLASPADAQSVCFADGNTGWLGARSGIFVTHDGGQRWRPQLDAGSMGGALLTTVSCSAHRAWAEIRGEAAMTQQSHVGFRLVRGRWQPIFAEQYLPHPGVRTPVPSPGSDAGPFAAAGNVGVFVDSCPGCQARTPHGLLSPTTTAAFVVGGHLRRRGSAGGLSDPYGVAFATPAYGWVVGRQVWTPTGTSGRAVERIVVARTTDAGRHWSTQLSVRSPV